MDYKLLTAPCGLDCFNRELYEVNITDALKNLFSKLLKCPTDEVKCAGCKVEGGYKLHFNECATYDCAAKKGLVFCSECEEFLCDYFNPASDQADKYPHNFKLYNLCRIKNTGFDNWVKEAGVIRKKIFHF